MIIILVEPSVVLKCVLKLGNNIVYALNTLKNITNIEFHFKS